MNSDLLDVSVEWIKVLTMANKWTHTGHGINNMHACPYSLQIEKNVFMNWVKNIFDSDKEWIWEIYALFSVDI